MSILSLWSLIMEYLVKISKKARILELKRRHLKITILTSNTLCPSRKIRRIDEEGQPAPEPQVEDDEYNLQRGIQMSLESSQAPVGGVAIREPVSGITRQLLVIEGKGKGIISDEQAAQLLLDLQKLKKKSTTDQYIISRRTPTTHDASTGSLCTPKDDTSETVFVNTSSPAMLKLC
ncbi:hypothetical protein Tco_0169937 [Tanacetum coccineum]